MDGNKIHDHGQIAESFNKFLSKVATKLWKTYWYFLPIDKHTLPPENYTEAGDLAEVTCASPENSLLTKLPLFDYLDDNSEDETVTLFCRFPQEFPQQIDKFGG